MNKSKREIERLRKELLQAIGVESNIKAKIDTSGNVILFISADTEN